MNRICASAIRLSLLGLTVPLVGHADSQARVPYSDSVWYPCDPQEAVALSGTYMRRVWETTDGNGVRHRHIVYALQGVDGVGQTSGARYVAGQNEVSSQQYDYVDNGYTVDVHSILIQKLKQVGGATALLQFQVDATYSSASEDPIDERIRFTSECRG